MDTAKKYLDMIVNDIHSVVIATTDDENRPVTRVIDIMLEDGRTFYFLTAKGKAFCEQLLKHPYIALTGMTGGEGMDRAHATMHRKAVSIRGNVACIGTEKLTEIFDANPYMAEIYLTEVSREALVVFTMTEGEGEFFDLSTKPITRHSFCIGETEKGSASGHEREPYLITDACTGCGKCAAVCPQHCIRMETVPFRIDQAHCLHCGNCFTDCPVKAVRRR